MTQLRLATRRSPLALAQAEGVRRTLLERGVEAELVALETYGDREPTAPLSEIAGKGIFAVEIQGAVIEGRADVAVHSAKDLPSETPTGLRLASVPERRDPADVLVGRSMAGLGPGATVATGSPRRRALLLDRRPDLNVIELRGNMATRLAVADRHDVDAVVAAAAALARLDLTQLIAERLDPNWFIPQIGQGALALEVRDDDAEVIALVESISHPASFIAVRAERAFLRELGAGCSIPAAAHASVANGVISLRALMAAVDGSRVLRGEMTGHDPAELGRAMAQFLRDESGGSELAGWRA